MCVCVYVCVYECLYLCVCVCLCAHVSVCGCVLEWLGETTLAVYTIHIIQVLKCIT